MRRYTTHKTRYTPKPITKNDRIQSCMRAICGFYGVLCVGYVGSQIFSKSILPNATGQDRGKLRNKLLKLGHGEGFPDFFIPVAKHGYAGLYVEIKPEGDSPLTKKGKFRTGTSKKYQHIARQATVLQQLQSQGNLACFVVGMKAGEKLIQWYLGNKQKPSFVEADFNKGKILVVQC